MRAWCTHEVRAKGGGTFTPTSGQSLGPWCCLGAHEGSVGARTPRGPGLCFTSPGAGAPQQ